MSKIKTEKKKIGELELDVKSTSTDVDKCKNPSCEAIVSDFQYFEQNGFCLDCYRGVRYDSEEQKNCDECNKSMSASSHFYAKGICYECYSIEFEKAFKDFPF